MTAAVIVFPGFMETSFVLAQAPADWPHLERALDVVRQAYVPLLIGVSAVILATSVGGHIIGHLLEPYAYQLKFDKEYEKSLLGAGKVIGFSERLIAVTLVAASEITALGFVIAAKSILRFSNMGSGTQRKIAEYIIIGTFLSFAWALGVGLLTRYALGVTGTIG